VAGSEVPILDDYREMLMRGSMSVSPERAVARGQIRQIVADAINQLPAPFRGYRAKLAALAKNHWFVLSYFHDAERRLDLWNLYILERAEGRIAGVLVGRARAGGM